MNTTQPPEIKKDSPFSTAAARTLHQGTENVSEASRLAMGNANEAIQQGREQLQGAFESATASANTAVQRGRDLMDDTYHAAASAFENAVIWSRNCVQRNPLSAAFGTLAIGIGLGLWASRQPRPSFQDRLAKDPVGALREALQSLSHR